MSCRALSLHTVRITRSPRQARRLQQRRVQRLGAGTFQLSSHAKDKPARSRSFYIIPSPNVRPLASSMLYRQPTLLPPAVWLLGVDVRLPDAADGRPQTSLLTMTTLQSKYSPRASPALTKAGDTVKTSAASGSSVLSTFMVAGSKAKSPWPAPQLGYWAKHQARCWQRSPSSWIAWSMSLTTAARSPALFHPLSTGFSFPMPRSASCSALASTSAALALEAMKVDVCERQVWNSRSVVDADCQVASASYKVSQDH